MPQTFAVNSNNDLYVDQNGNMAIVSGLQAVLQICAQVAKAQRGEMIFATNQGIPNFQTIWTGVPNIPQFEAALRQAILAAPNVVEIISLNSTITSNVLFYQIVILTTYGQGVVNGNL